MLKDVLLLTVFPGAMAFAAATDLFTMTLPNRIALVLVVGFFLLAPMVGLGLEDIGLHALVGALALALGFFCFAMGWVGGGDAKLFAATALWIGPQLLFTYSLDAALIGGALTLAILLWRGMPLPVTFAGQGWLLRLHDRGAGVPYGIALAVAGLLAYPESAFMAGIGH
jgi:prepilin peptidase CpaA